MSIIMLFLPQVADTLLLVYSAGEEVEPSRQLCLDCCCAQGLPATCHTTLVSNLHVTGGLEHCPVIVEHSATWGVKIVATVTCGREQGSVQIDAKLGSLLLYTAPKLSSVMCVCGGMM